MATPTSLRCADGHLRRPTSTVRKRAEHTSAQGSAASASPGCHVPVGSPGRGIAAEEWVPLEQRKLCTVERPLPKLDVVSDGLWRGERWGRISPERAQHVGP